MFLINIDNYLLHKSAILSHCTLDRSCVRLPLFQILWTISMLKMQCDLLDVALSGWVHLHLT